MQGERCVRCPVVAQCLGFAPAALPEGVARGARPGVGATGASRVTTNRFGNGR